MRCRKPRNAKHRIAVGVNTAMSQTRKTQRGRRLTLAGLAMLACAATAAASASATLPGRNGLITATSARKGGCNELRAIFTVRFDGRRVRNLRQLTCETSEAHDNPRWTPNGKRILYRDIGDPEFGQPPPFDLRMMNADGSNNEVVGQSSSDTFAWAPNGQTLAWNGIWLGPVTNPRERFLAPGVHPAWSPDGRSLAVVELRDENCTNLSVYDAATGERERVLVRGKVRDGTCYNATRWPDWSPDGRKIVYSGTGARSGDSTSHYEIFRIGVRGRSRQRLTRNNGDDDQPIWSPDGRWIAYTRDGAGLTFMRPDGSPKIRTQIGVQSPSWQSLPRRR